MIIYDSIIYKNNILFENQNLKNEYLLPQEKSQDFSRNQILKIFEKILFEMMIARIINPAERPTKPAISRNPGHSHIQIIFPQKKS